MKRNITRFITRRLKLKVNEQKSAVARPVRRKSLGFSFTVRGPKRRIAGKALVRFKRRVRELTARARGIGIEQRAKELGDYLRGWKAYFGFCETPSVLETLDQWLRRRLRSLLWQQWQRGKVRFSRLCARGVDRTLAATTAGSSHGPWRIAISPALGAALPTLTSIRSAFPGCLPDASSIHRTAGCGPACPVVWEGRGCEASPYPDQRTFGAAF